MLQYILVEHPMFAATGALSSYAPSVAESAGYAVEEVPLNRYDLYTAATNSDRIRNEARIATLATGAIGTVDAVNTLVGGGRADLCRLIRTAASGPRLT